MGIGAFISGFEVCDYHTESANTAITEAIQAHDGQRLALIDLFYLCGSTAHNVLLMYAKDAAAYPGSSRNTVDGTTAGHLISGQKVVDVVTTPLSPAGAAAAQYDIVAYQLVDGTWEFNTIGSVSTNAITLTNNIAGVDAGAGAVALADGAKFLIFGISTDLAYQRMVCTASVENHWGNGLIKAVHPYVGEPWYLSIDNLTAQGYLGSALFAHINK